MPEPVVYRCMELWMCDTCNFRCGYCTLAESGAVCNEDHCAMYRDGTLVHTIGAFFEKYTFQKKHWLVIFTGGEPLLIPHLDVLIRELIRQGNRICIFTNLAVPLNHQNYSWLDATTAKQVEYMMCSFHPEWTEKEDLFFERVHRLKMMGIQPIVRFVGHPRRLHLLEKLEQRCQDVGVTFYPTTLFTSRYPQAYTPQEKKRIQEYAKGFSSLIQLEGGLDVSGLSCRAGSLVFAADIPRGGDIRPCISVESPIIGNIIRRELKEFSYPVSCFKKDKVCTCDVHFQQGIVERADDSEEFLLIRQGRGRPSFGRWPKWKRANRLETTDRSFAGQGGVQDDSVLVYDRAEVRRRYRSGQGTSPLARIYRLLKAIHRKK